MSIFFIEFFLTSLIILVWLGPFLCSIRFRVFNLLHPQALIPIWLVYFVINSMLEKWRPWMLEADPGIIRTTEMNLKLYPDYFIVPLILMLLAGLFFHFGSRVLTGSINKSPTSNIKRLNNLPIVNKSTRTEFSILIFLVICIAWIPNAMIPNEGLGTFWTYPLAMTALLAPFVLFKTNKILFTLSLFFVAITIINLKSKAALIYPVIPIIIYYFYFNFKLKSFFSLIVPIIILAFLWILLSLGGFDFVFAKLFHRDYQFDVFAALVHYSPNGFLGNFGQTISGEPNGPVLSWTWAEIRNSIPSILNPFKGETINPAKLVSQYFLPVDYDVIPDSYFNRHFLFSGYYDLGLAGVLIASFLGGLTYSFFWRLTTKLINSYQEIWPLFVYLPIPAISSYFVASGNIGYGFINALIPAFTIFLCVFIAKTASFIRNNSFTEKKYA